MRAIHLKAKQLSDWSLVTIQTVLAQLGGVVEIATMKSAGIVSVLFDETRASADQILAAVRSTGIDAVLLG